MSVNEVVSFAEANGLDLSPEQAAQYMQRLQNGELSDQELEAIAGGKSRRRVTIINRRTTIFNRIFVRR